jgi:hypothetical protein
MKTLKLGNITLKVDVERTRQFYDNQNGFICDCPDCTNYVNNIPNIQNSLNGLDKKLGIDLYKAVGQGMDELMPHDYEAGHLDVIPYYVIGKCYINDEELEKQSSGPIWPNIKRVEYKLIDDLSILIINTSGDIEIKNAKNVLTIWLEYKTELKNIK